jgi:hypothetical protein
VELRIWQHHQRGLVVEFCLTCSADEAELHREVAEPFRGPGQYFVRCGVGGAGDDAGESPVRWHQLESAE